MRASSLSVFARAFAIPVSSELTTTTRSTNGSRIRATPQQIPVTSNATRSDASRLSANARTRPAWPAPDPQTGSHRPHRSPPHRTHGAHQDRSRDRPTAARPSLTSTPMRTCDGRTSGTTAQTDTSSLSAQSSQLARAAERKPRALSPSIKTAYPSAFSHARPLSPISRNYDPTRTDLTNAVSCLEGPPRPTGTIARSSRRGRGFGSSCCCDRHICPSGCSRSDVWELVPVRRYP